MTKLWAMRGYSGSGKSTLAAKVAAENDAVVINRDYLRKMMLNSWWTGDNDDEDRVTLAEEASVDALLRQGTSIVVDATHLNAAYLRKWARLATRVGVGFEVVDVVEDVDTCHARNYARQLAGERSVEPSVINSQAKRFPVRKWPEIVANPPLGIEPVHWRAGLPEAIIVDIDGTLAHIPEGGRSPYDYTRVLDDDVDLVVRGLVEQAHAAGDRILIVSGRDDICFADTEQWLNRNSVPYDHLFMRPTAMRDINGNKAPDFLVKHHLFETHIRDRFNILYCLDDRRQVIDMWRALGLKVLDVAGNDF